MTFEKRLKNYAGQYTLKRNRRSDGLTHAQYRRLIKKDRHAFALRG